MSNYKLTKGAEILRLSDNAYIPADPANVDYATYLKWVAEGNTPVTAETLPEIKARVRNEIVRQRDNAITGGFSFMGKLIDSDRDSVMAITGAAVAALAAKAAALPYSVTWTCADDSTLTIDADGVLGLAVSMAMFADAQHNKARPLKDAIKNAVDADTVKQVKW